MSVFKRWNGTSWEVVGPQISSTRFDDTNHMIAPEYSSTDIYNVGDYVVQSDKLYKCISAIESAEEWTAAHWTQVIIGEEVSTLNNAINNDLGKKLVTFTYTEGFYINYNGGISTGNNFAYSSPVAVSKGEKVIFTAQGYSTNIAMIYTCDSTGDNRTVVARSAGSEVKEYDYLAQSDGYVGFSFDIRQTHEAIILEADSVLIFSDRLDLAEGTSAVNSAILEVTKKNYDAIAASYCILESGLSLSKSGYSLQKYSVTQGEKLLIKTMTPDEGFANYVFSSNSSISGSSTASIISVETKKVDGEITVPNGATWLVFSVKNIDNITGIYTSPFVNIPDTVGSLSDKIGSYGYPSIFNIEETSPISFSILNSNGTITTNSSSLSVNNKVSGKIYLSSDMEVTYKLATSTDYPLINEYDVNDNFIRVAVRGQGQSVPVTGTYTTGNGVAYIRIAYVTTYVNCEFSALHNGVNRVSVLEGKVQELINGEVQSTSIIALNEGFASKAIQGQRRLNIQADYQTKPPILRLLHFSDIHGDMTELSRIIEFKNYYSTFIDDAICTGDIVRNVFADGMEFWDSVNGSEDILMCIGNHDVAITGNYGQYNVTVQQAYDQYFAPYIANWNVVHSGINTYWYKDYTEQKIRLVALDYLLTGNDATAQNTWLQNILANAKTNNLAIVGIEHTPPINRTKIPCTFTSILNDFSGQFGNPYMASVQSFINDGGIFLCWLAGHTHVDYVEYDSNYPDQPFVIVTAAKSGTGYEDGDRVIGDKSQDAFNMVYLDSDARLVKLVRVGQDRDAHLRSINTLTLDVSTSPATVVWND